MAARGEGSRRPRACDRGLDAVRRERRGAGGARCRIQAGARQARLDRRQESAAPELSVFGKLPEILKQIAPHLTRAALLFNPDNPAGASYARQWESAAPALAMRPAVVPVHGPADIERAVESFAGEPNGGLLFPSDLTLLAHRELIIDLAARHRLPAIYADRIMVTSGGLVSYSADRTEMYRQAASYVDRILRGESPAIGCGL